MLTRSTEVEEISRQLPETLPSQSTTSSIIERENEHERQRDVRNEYTLPQTEPPLFSPPAGVQLEEAVYDYPSASTSAPAQHQTYQSQEVISQQESTEANHQDQYRPKSPVHRPYSPTDEADTHGSAGVKIPFDDNESDAEHVPLPDSDSDISRFEDESHTVNRHDLLTSDSDANTESTYNLSQFTQGAPSTAASTAYEDQFGAQQKVSESEESAVAATHRYERKRKERKERKSAVREGSSFETLEADESQYQSPKEDASEDESEYDEESPRLGLRGGDLGQFGPDKEARREAKEQRKEEKRRQKKKEEKRRREAEQSRTKEHTIERSTRTGSLSKSREQYAPSGSSFLSRVMGLGNSSPSSPRPDSSKGHRRSNSDDRKPLKKSSSDIDLGGKERLKAGKMKHVEKDDWEMIVDGKDQTRKLHRRRSFNADATSGTHTSAVPTKESIESGSATTPARGILIALPADMDEKIEGLRLRGGDLSMNDEREIRRHKEKKEKKEKREKREKREEKERYDNTDDTMEIGWDEEKKADEKMETKSVEEEKKEKEVALDVDVEKSYDTNDGVILNMHVDDLRLDKDDDVSSTSEEEVHGKEEKKKLSRSQRKKMRKKERKAAEKASAAAADAAAAAAAAATTTETATRGINDSGVAVPTILPENFETTEKEVLGTTQPKTEEAFTEQKVEHSVDTTSISISESQLEVQKEIQQQERSDVETSTEYDAADEFSFNDDDVYNVELPVSQPGSPYILPDLPLDLPPLPSSPVSPGPVISIQPVDSAPSSPAQSTAEDDDDLPPLSRHSPVVSPSGSSLTQRHLAGFPVPVFDYVLSPAAVSSPGEEVDSDLGTIEEESEPENEEELPPYDDFDHDSVHRGLLSPIEEVSEPESSVHGGFRYHLDHFDASSPPRSPYIEEPQQYEWTEVQEGDSPERVESISGFSSPVIQPETSFPVDAANSMESSAFVEEVMEDMEDMENVEDMEDMVHSQSLQDHALQPEEVDLQIGTPSLFHELPEPACDIPLPASPVESPALPEDEFRTVENPHTDEEPDIVEEPKLIEEPEHVPEPQHVQELPSVQEPQFIQEYLSVEEPQFIEQSQVIEQPQLIEQTQFIEEHEVIEEPEFIEEEPEFSDSQWTMPHALNTAEEVYEPSDPFERPEMYELPESDPGSPYELPDVPWWLPPLPESPTGSPVLAPRKAPSTESNPIYITDVDVDQLLPEQLQPAIRPALGMRGAARAISAFNQNRRRVSGEFSAAQRSQSFPTTLASDSDEDEEERPVPQKSGRPFLGFRAAVRATQLLQPVHREPEGPAHEHESPIAGPSQAAGRPFLGMRSAVRAVQFQQKHPRINAQVPEGQRSYSPPESPTDEGGVSIEAPPRPAIRPPTLRSWSSNLSDIAQRRLQPEDFPLPASNPSSPYEHPQVPWWLPPLPDSPLGSSSWLEPSLHVPATHLAPAIPAIPVNLPQLPPLLRNSPRIPINEDSEEEVEEKESATQSATSAFLPENLSLPTSREGSPYMLPQPPVDLPELPLSPEESPVILGIDISLPASEEGSPYMLPKIPDDLPQLPESPLDSPTLRPEDVSLPSSRENSPYIYPVAAENLPQLPESPWWSPTDGPSPLDLELPESAGSSPYVLPKVPTNLPRLPSSPWDSPTLGPAPQDEDLPPSRPNSPYELPDVPKDLPRLPASPWYSPTFGPGPQDLDLPESAGSSPYVLPQPPTNLPQLPSSPWDSPTLGPAPQDEDLPPSRPNSPYELPDVPKDLPELPRSSWHSPTLGPAPQNVDMPVSRPDSPYELPKVPENLPQLPASPWYSPTLGPRPQELDLPISEPGSPYELPKTPDDLPKLPSSPWDSPTLGPRPQELDLPLSRPSSPYELPKLPDNLPVLPVSPWDSPVLGPAPQDVDLPSSVPGSPYELPKIPDDLPELPQSAWNSPTLGPRPTELDLPISRPGSPYELVVTQELPGLPASPWNSPTLGPRPTELDLPFSAPGSPYELPKLPENLPVLPASPWDSPVLGPAPQDVDLPFSAPGSPYELPKTPDDLPQLPSSSWNSPTLGPRPTELDLPISRPGSPYELAVTQELPRLPVSPWNSPTLGPRPQELDLPSSEPGSPYILADAPTCFFLPQSSWNSPTLGPRPTDLDLPTSRPGSPYELDVTQELPGLPASPWNSPTLGPAPQDVDLPSSVPGSPYELPKTPDDLPQLPLSAWNSPTLGPAPQDATLPISTPGSPYSLEVTKELPELPVSPWDSPTIGPTPVEVALPESKPGSPYQVEEMQAEVVPALDESPKIEAVESQVQESPKIAASPAPAVAVAAPAEVEVELPISKPPSPKPASPYRPEQTIRLVPSDDEDVLFQEQNGGNVMMESRGVDPFAAAFAEPAGSAVARTPSPQSEDSEASQASQAPQASRAVDAAPVKRLSRTRTQRQLKKLGTENGGEQDEKVQKASETAAEKAFEKKEGHLPKSMTWPKQAPRASMDEEVTPRASIESNRSFKDKGDDKEFKPKILSRTKTFWTNAFRDNSKPPSPDEEKNGEGGLLGGFGSRNKSVGEGLDNSDAMSVKSGKSVKSVKMEKESRIPKLRRSKTSSTESDSGKNDDKGFNGVSMTSFLSRKR
ncbi:hypothetical protein BZA77DRAFT_68753 [Pyronema omphalodes]|nr:hypothetical protein BZA77DRAFT_68753 [Pyronema omphalodes]